MPFATEVVNLSGDILACLRSDTVTMVELSGKQTEEKKILSFVNHNNGAQRRRLTPLDLDTFFVSDGERYSTCRLMWELLLSHRF